MTRYWLKIVLGAVLIFVVGMAIWMGARKGVSTVHTVMKTSEPLTIPIKVVNFRVDGANLGRVERLRLLRSAPEVFTAVNVAVTVDSAAAVERLRNCTLRLDDLERLDERSTFVCVTAGSPPAAGEFERFGEVTIEGTDVVLPLLLPAAAVRDLQRKGWQGADSLAPAAPPSPPVAEVQAGAEAAAGATPTVP